jgi:DNA-binding transcriptional regulator YiaG
MEPMLPISLRPSPVTKLRNRLDMPEDVAAGYLGMTVRQLQYLEQHTMRVSSTMLASISVLLAPGADIHPQTLWDWLASEIARQASLDESEA